MVGAVAPIVRGYVAGRYGQVHYRRTGGDTAFGKPVLVLLHQNPSSSLEYVPLMQALAADRDVVAFDTPGYGMSDAPDAPLSAAGYAACLIEAIEALGLAGALGCDVYGYHTGTVLAAEMAIGRPDLVRRLMLSGIPMRTLDDRRVRLATAVEAPDLDEAGEVALGMARGLWDYVVRKRPAGIALDRAAALWVDKLTPLARAQWAYQAVWGYDFEARLPLVRQPVLLVQANEELKPHSIAAALLCADTTIIELDRYDRDILVLPDAIADLVPLIRNFLG